MRLNCYFKLTFFLLMFLNFKSEAFPILEIVPFQIPSVNESVLSAGYYSQPFLDSQQKGNIRIMVWNIDGGKGRFWKEEFLSFAQDVDLILLQEVAIDKKKMFSFFQEEVFQGFQMAFSFLHRKSQTKKGVAIGSRAEPSSFGFSRSLDRELILNVPKIISYATFKLCEQEECDLLVVNVHMLWLSFFEVYKRQLESIKKVVEIHQGPVIVAGDFNTWSLTRKNIVRRYMKNLGLSEVTFENRKGITHPMTRLTLDYVFVSSNLFVEESFIGGTHSSDHRPLFISLEVLEDP